MTKSDNLKMSISYNDKKMRIEFVGKEAADTMNYITDLLLKKQENLTLTESE